MPPVCWCRAASQTSRRTSGTRPATTKCTLSATAVHLGRSIDSGDHIDIAVRLVRRRDQDFGGYDFRRTSAVVAELRET